MKRKKIIIITIILLLIAAALYGFSIFKARQNAARENGQVYGFREFLNIGSLDIFSPGGEDINTDFEPLPSDSTLDPLEDRNGNGVPDGLEDQNGNRIIDQFERPDGSGYISRPSGIPILLPPGINPDYFNPDYSNPDNQDIYTCGITNFSANGTISLILTDPENVTINWSTENCEYVTISGIDGELPASGNTTLNISSSEVLTLNSYPSGASAYVSIFLIEDSGLEDPIIPSDQTPRCMINSFTINGDTVSTNIAKGGNANISWSSTNCEYVTISGFSGSQDTGGTLSRTIETNTTFTITGYPNGQTLSVNAYIDTLWSGGEGPDYVWSGNEILNGCLAKDINIEFTQEELEKLADLQRRYNVIAQTLKSNEAVSEQYKKYLDSALSTVNTKESREFCEQAKGSIADVSMNKRIPTPFWNAQAEPSLGYPADSNTFTNFPIYTSDYEGRESPRSAYETPSLWATLFERIFRINIW